MERFGSDKRRAQVGGSANDLHRFDAPRSAPQAGVFSSFLTGIIEEDGKVRQE
jgi:hypothetical protein